MEDGHANSIAPGKRPMHTLNTYVVLKDGKPILTGGTPGTDFQVQCNLQMITGFVDHGLSPKELMDSPRWQSTPGTEPLTADSLPEVLLESRLHQLVSGPLKALGHRVVSNPLNDVVLGNVQLLSLDGETGVFVGASDPRGDGHPVAL